MRVLPVMLLHAAVVSVQGSDDDLTNATAVAASYHATMLGGGTVVQVEAAAHRRKQLADRANIVFFITDDQDQMLGASFPPLNDATPFRRTAEVLAGAGATATNTFVHTPICCPSRSELLSGRYLHNIKQKPGTTPKPSAVCMHVNESKINNHTFAKPLHDAGYAVGMFGKYLNNVPDWKVAPPGFDAWLANGGGDYIAPRFGAKNLSFAGIPDGMVNFGVDDYTTSVVGNISLAWIKTVVQSDASPPFFAYIAPKAAHEPFIPAPWYLDAWDPSWPAHEPRDNPAYNCSAESRADKHGNLATQPMITPEAQRVITGVYKNRWRTLMSVDDLIGDAVQACDDLGVLDSTYFFFTSDHGFQLGENNILMDKRHVYDFDTRVHLLARGPGIAPGSLFPYPATLVDLAPTFLGIAGLPKPPTMDGHSLMPLLASDEVPAQALASPDAAPAIASEGTTSPSASSSLPAAVHRHLRAVGSGAEYRASWRTEVFLEHYFVAINNKCVENCTVAGQYPKRDSDCVDLPANDGCWGPPQCMSECYATESKENNFIAIHTINAIPTSQTHEILYAEFATGDQDAADVDFAEPDFYEMYDTTSDPWQMTNRYNDSDLDEREALHARLRAWFACAGDACP